MSKNIVITGITGQDGSHMLDYLLKITDYNIIGTVRLLSNVNYVHINHNIGNPRLTLAYMDLTDEHSISNIIKTYTPVFFINFAAQSFVGESWNQPTLTFMSNTISIIHILENIRQYVPTCRFYSAGSSEEFGDVDTTPQTLKHPLKPRSPYGASKCAARHIVKVYRDSYNLFAIHCVLFNHEGTRRGKKFVTRKITHNLSKIKYQIKTNGTIIPFELGNIYTKRDWSDSEDFVQAVWIMLNRKNAKEYILSSNTSHSIKEFIDVCCEILDIDCVWDIHDDPLQTKLLYKNQPIITISEKFYRPAEVESLQGDSSITYKELNWKPRTSFKDLVKKMCTNDYKLVKQEEENMRRWAYK
jgi:GDPmannose 4,6-dehydratase